MLEEVATAIGTGAAGNVVAYMLNGRVDALLVQIARIFRRGSESERSAVLETLKDDVAALRQQKVSETEITKRWTELIASYLIAHPEARKDVEAFNSDFGKTVYIGSQHNHGAGPFIGGDNYGDMKFGSQE